MSSKASWNFLNTFSLLPFASLPAWLVEEVDEDGGNAAFVAVPVLEFATEAMRARAMPCGQRS